MSEVTKNAPQQAIKNLGNAYTIYLRDIERAKCGEIPWARVRTPRFKRKGVHDSFRADNGPSKGRWHAVRTIGKRIKLPCIGWVKMRESVRFQGQLCPRSFHVKPIAGT
jgi:putative transposase